MPELFAGRIVSKDGEFALIEVGVRNDSRFTLRGGDEYVTMQFVRMNARTRTMEPFDPFVKGAKP